MDTLSKIFQSNLQHRLQVHSNNVSASRKIAKCWKTSFQQSWYVTEVDSDIAHFAFCRSYKHQLRWKNFVLYFAVVVLCHYSPILHFTWQTLALSYKVILISRSAVKHTLKCIYHMLCLNFLKTVCVMMSISCMTVTTIICRPSLPTWLLDWNHMRVSCRSRIAGDCSSCGLRSPTTSSLLKKKQTHMLSVLLITIMGIKECVVVCRQQAEF